MKTAITETSVIEQQSLNTDDSDNSLIQGSIGKLDDIDFDLERIMFEELAKGLPSDIPMADF